MQKSNSATTFTTTCGNLFATSFRMLCCTSPVALNSLSIKFTVRPLMWPATHRVAAAEPVAARVASTPNVKSPCAANYSPSVDDCTFTFPDPQLSLRPMCASHCPPPFLGLLDYLPSLITCRCYGFSQLVRPWWPPSLIVCRCDCFPQPVRPWWPPR